MDDGSDVACRFRSTIKQRTVSLLRGVMQTYSVHLEQFLKFSKANLKRMTVAHPYALKLLRYLQESTGGPRYDD
jgi:hypothetical protein